MLYRPQKARLLKITYFLFFFAAARLTLLSTPKSSAKPLVYQLGQIAGVLGLSGLVVQLWLAGRMKFLERGVGLDRLLRWHALNSRFTGFLIASHPLLLFWPAIRNGASLGQIIAFFTLYHWLGVLAVLMIFLIIGTTVLSNRIKLNYERWRSIHKIGYLVIGLGFVHSFFVGSDILNRRPLLYWWIFLAGLTVFVLIYRQGIRKLRLRNSRYEITKIISETPHVRTIRLEPLLRQGRGLSKHTPGQFAFVTFISSQLPQEEHPFTISASPTEAEMSFTIKEAGDFTSSLGNLNVGDQALIEGPYGVFTNQQMPGPFVFIAGGIGITPLRSMLRAMADKDDHQETLLIYGNKTSQDVVFKRELDKLNQACRWLRIVYVLSQERKDGFHHGRIDAKLLQKEIQDYRLPTYFLAGPPMMVTAIEKTLLKLGVERRRLFTEKFALR